MTVQWYHVGPGLQSVQIVRPLLHHFSSLGKVRCAVIGRNYAGLWTLLDVLESLIGGAAGIEPSDILDISIT